jgi:hypothetical protein
MSLQQVQEQDKNNDCANQNEDVIGREHNAALVLILVGCYARAA